MYIASITYKLALEYTNKGDYQSAFRLWESLAKEGYSEAQYNLALMYIEGQGVSKDFKKAFYWSQKAAKQGDKEAQFNLGLMYYQGKGTKKNIGKALSLWKQSCAQGVQYACENYDIASKQKR